LEIIMPANLHKTDQKFANFATHRRGYRRRGGLARPSGDEHNSRRSPPSLPVTFSSNKKPACGLIATDAVFVSLLSYHNG
jgi:hypothetical protein